MVTFSFEVTFIVEFSSYYEVILNFDVMFSPKQTSPNQVSYSKYPKLTLYNQTFTTETSIANQPNQTFQSKPTKQSLQN